MAQHQEKDFESHIEDHLFHHGYHKLSPQGFDPALALFPEELLTFLHRTQPNTWEALSRLHHKDTRHKVLKEVARQMNRNGSLHVLRKGVEMDGEHLHLAFFKPSHQANPRTLERYRANRLCVTRQLRYHPERQQSLDMVLSLNGVPLVTLEIKNHLTGQRVTHALKQYKEDRDHRIPLLRFKQRTLVHFAVDPDEIFMTTRLEGKDTSFLPFNQGGQEGSAGNPPNPEGHRTAYLWEEVLERDSLLDILARFMLLERSEDQKKERLIFPRYHQLRVVRRLVNSARRHGVGKNYLVQHSAGSGKSNSIAWLAHRLSNLHDAQDQRIVDSVVVVTDRRVLDRQLQRTIAQFEQRAGVVKAIHNNSRQLAQELQLGAPIIITTLQKFPHVLDQVQNLPARRYAVIVDEAHSSQSGDQARDMKKALGQQDLEDAQDQMVREARSRGRQANLSFFAFTATPKGKTLELFGQPRPGPEDQLSYEPFDVYSMRQAIEEGFILDVLAHYTTYKSFYELQKSAEVDPRFKVREANKQLKRYMEDHKVNLANKTRVMLRHFMEHTRHKLGGQARAMVVAASRMRAVYYFKEFNRQIKAQQIPNLKVLVAFSGSIPNEDASGEQYTEASLNGAEVKIAKTFKADPYRILIVANKYQTGFDEPLLHTMYVDKKLSGVQAVQTLSRLNRCHEGKRDTFVLDFANERETIQEAFQTYYQRTINPAPSQPERLYDLKHDLEDTEIFDREDVEVFCKLWFAPRDKRTHAKLHQRLDITVERFEQQGEETQQAFRDHQRAYLRLYPFLAQVISFHDSDLERLYLYLRNLATKLPRRDHSPGQLQDSDLEDLVDLTSYRLDLQARGALQLQEGQEGQATSPGAGPDPNHTGRDQEAPLSSIIDMLNERFGTDFKEEDRLIFAQYEEVARNNEELQAEARVNDLDSFALSFDKKLDHIVIERMDTHIQLSTRYLEDEDFKRSIQNYLRERIYRELRGAQEQPTQPTQPTTTPEAHKLAPSPEEGPDWAIYLGEDELLEARWHTLGHALQAAGIPAPENVHIDLKIDGRTTGSPAIMRWRAEAGYLALVEHAEEIEQWAGTACLVTPETNAQTVVRAFEAWAGDYR